MVTTSPIKTCQMTILSKDPKIQRYVPSPSKRINSRSDVFPESFTIVPGNGRRSRRGCQQPAASGQRPAGAPCPAPPHSTYHPTYHPTLQRCCATTLLRYYATALLRYYVSLLPWPLQPMLTAPSACVPSGPPQRRCRVATASTPPALTAGLPAATPVPSAAPTRTAPLRRGPGAARPGAARPGAARPGAARRPLREELPKTKTKTKTPPPPWRSR